MIEDDGRVELPATTSERVMAQIETSADPTGTAPDFALSQGVQTPPSSGWLPGVWSSSGWTARTGRVDALTPLTNATGFEIEAGQVYDLWMRFDVQGEAVVIRAGQLSAF